MLNQASETALRWDNPVVGDASGEAQSLGAQVKRALRILRMKH